jgi:16S rRNA (cytidine1402-2'-O)-methyltransferase
MLFEPLTAALYLVATPIGNLGDITLRALSVLARADVIYCEDTRHSAKLLQHYAIPTRTRPFHEHNEDREIERAIADLEAGKRIAIVSDAGTPLLSDPGFKLVRAAAAAGIAIIPIPGASALLAALTASGLPTDAFFFAGFLPPKQAARRARLAELSQIPGSLVFYEAPHRVAETVADMASLLGGRQAVIARELTKLHEEVARGSLQTLAEATATEGLKGEVVIVVEPRQAEAVTDEALGARLADALEVMSLKDAAKALADELGVPKARVYGLGIKAKGGNR